MLPKCGIALPPDGCRAETGQRAGTSPRAVEMEKGRQSWSNGRESAATGRWRELGDGSENSSVQWRIIIIIIIAFLTRDGGTELPDLEGRRARRLGRGSPCFVSPQSRQIAGSSCSGGLEEEYKNWMQTGLPVYTAMTPFLASLASSTCYPPPRTAIKRLILIASLQSDS